MSTSHRVITSHPTIIKPNMLHIIQGVLDELNKDPKVKVETITVDRHRMESFSIYFAYGEEKRKLFICESQDTYLDVGNSTIHSGGVYFNLNVWGSNKEIMDIVKVGIRKHVPNDVSIYECVNDAIEDRFVRVGA
ncbi:hypothetical protein GAP161_138 [Cronobacter phage vB_CsaM_GAP161]|jgi:hypothetical protein|uniref:Uncharacterized protein n=2 Tax=Pseudotevenvirus TaxID=2842979 RepID=A0A7T3TLQ5_9CAUD|nr:hypothetical protein GAP161_138 [Cronobacter phage vB_CsaM_GAP161]AFC22248.1 hypothetical protein GAP161_138 [Cronobacter phage vB_CsaM_GAP161]QPX76497.1 hypothetical protein [Cronobacter phage vB_CsaM_SemperBestia]WOL25299.1 hypothetical protein iPHageKPN12i_00232 [Klebsiella phage iPHaGe-KPN-12i]